MVWGSRRIEPNRVTPQGFEEQGVPDAAKGDHIDGAAEDLREVVAKAHVGAEEVGRVVGEVDKHIDVAAAWVEVIARSRTHELKERHAAPRAGGSDAVEVVGNETDHAKIIPWGATDRYFNSRCVAHASSCLALHGSWRAPCSSLLGKGNPVRDLPPVHRRSPGVPQFFPEAGRFQRKTLLR